MQKFMDPDFDITLSSAERPSGDSAKEQFLTSLGLDERHLLGVAGGDRIEGVLDEGVVLSSTPDDLGFSSPGAAPDRGLSRYSGFSQKERETIQAITLPAEEEPRPEPEDQNPAENSVDPLDEEENLSLHCPECRGSLVLKRRHLGIEGACVWCHTPIVAAESGRDGQVRVFPILGQANSIPKSDTSGNAGASVGEPASPPEATSAPQTKISSSEFSSATSHPEPAFPSGISLSLSATTVSFQPVAEPSTPVADFGTPEGVETAKEVSQRPMEGFDISGFLPLQEKMVETPDSTDALTDQAVNTPDLESLYETGGFLAAAPAVSVPTGFAGAPSPSATLASDSENPVPGFGNFIRNAAVDVAAPPVVETPQPTTDHSTQNAFFTPTPWGPPAPNGKPAGAPDPLSAESSPAPASTFAKASDDAPVTLPDGFASGFAAPASAAAPSAPTWEAAFGSLKDSAAPASGSATGPEARETTGFTSGFRDTAFTSDSSSVEADRSAPPAAATDSVFSIQPSTAAKVQEEVKSLEESRSFAPPFQAFATGSSMDGESTVRNIFGDPSTAGSLWGAGGPADEAPAPFAPLAPLPDLGSPLAREEAEPLFTAEESDPSLVLPTTNAQASTSMFADFRVADPDEPVAAPAPESITVAGPPALPTSTAEAASAMPVAAPVTPAAMPQVTSQPLGAKPKPKVRKGFIVLMVVIVGFASGAALASFVLPVEQYVNAARAFMESKFSASSGLAIPQMPAMPDGMDPTSESPTLEPPSQP